MRHEGVVARTQHGFRLNVALILVLAACGGAASPGEGEEGGSGGGEDDTGGDEPGPGGGKGGGDNPSSSCNLAEGAVATTMRRLTIKEYDNAVADLVGESGKPAAAALGEDESVGGFASNSLVTVAQGDAEKLASVARGVAERAVMRLGDVLKCGSGQGEEACALAFIDRFGKLAYRRKLTTEERDQLAQLYRDKAKTDGHVQGVRLVIEAALQMPQFLYRPVIGVKTSKSGINRLTGDEIASRLSFFLWASVPDEPLLAAAESGALDSADGVKTQAERMVKDGKFDRALESFSHQWLDLTHEPTKDTVRYPSFSPEVWEVGKASVTKFWSHVLRDTDGKLERLFGEPVAFVDAKIAPLYGMTSSATSLQKVSTDAKTRGGILTHPTLLTALAGTTESAPVRRGLFVRSRLLCQPPPPPPPDGVPPIPAESPSQTQRQRLEQHRKTPSCAACHAFFDPLGLSFEHYDAVGAYRDKEHGLEIDASGELTMTDVDGTFKDSTELIGRLKKSELVADCLSAQFFRFAVGRIESEGETCVIKSVTKSLFQRGYSLREALVSLATSDVFRFVTNP